MDMKDIPLHPNCRCVLIRIKLLDLPNQIPFVIGGRHKSICEILRLPKPPIKILFGSN